MSNSEMRRIAYVYATGYGPGVDFTLKDWLIARELYNKNRAEIKKLLGI
jgi:hypothetical protein